MFHTNESIRNTGQFFTSQRVPLKALNKTESENHETKYQIKLNNSLKENIGYNAKFWGRSINQDGTKDDYLASVIDQTPAENSYMHQYKKKLNFGSSNQRLNSWINDQKSNQSTSILHKSKNTENHFDTFENENAIKVIDYNRLVKEERLFQTIDHPLNLTPQKSEGNEALDIDEIMWKIVFIQQFFRSYLKKKSIKRQSTQDGSVQIIKEMKKIIQELNEENEKFKLENKELKEKLSSKLEDELISQKSEFTEIVNNYKQFVEKLLADKKEMKTKLDESNIQNSQLLDFKSIKETELEMAYNHIEELERENNKLHINLGLFVFFYVYFRKNHWTN